MTVGQSKRRWAEGHCEPAREPLGQKMDSAFAPMLDIRPHIEKIMRGDWTKEQCRQFAAHTQPHPMHRERNQTDECPAIPQIQFNGTSRWSVPASTSKCNI